MKHPFFKNHGPFKIDDLLKDLKLKDIENFGNDLVDKTCRSSVLCLLMMYGLELI